MSKVRVAGFSVSIDGFSAGVEQSLDNPLGRHGPEFFQWMFPTRFFHTMHDREGGDVGVDHDFAERSMSGFGAFILGRNMFGPIRGPWPTADQPGADWKGWWGPNPPYHAPTYVLTQYPRKPLQMEGGTTFHFVTGGIHEALRLAREAAGSKDIKIGGGVSTVHQYLQANLVDSIHLALTPAILGQGEALFPGIDLRALGFKLTERVPTDRATHVVLQR